MFDPVPQTQTDHLQAIEEMRAHIHPFGAGWLARREMKLGELTVIAEGRGVTLGAAVEECYIRYGEARAKGAR